MGKEDSRDDTFESLASGGGFRGQIRKELKDREREERRVNKKKTEEDPYSSTALGRKRRGRYDDENFL